MVRRRLTVWPNRHAGSIPASHELKISVLPVGRISSVLVYTP